MVHPSLGLRMAVSGGGACGGPASLRTVRLRPVSLLTVRRRAAPSAGGSGGAGGIAYLWFNLWWRLRQAGAGSVRRGLELGAEVGRRLGTAAVAMAGAAMAEAVKVVGMVAVTANPHVLEFALYVLVCYEQ